MVTVALTVVVLMLAFIFFQKPHPTLPPHISEKGLVALDDNAFAPSEEARRDLGRTFSAKGIYYSRGDGNAPQIIPFPDGLSSATHKEALDAQFSAFMAALSSIRGCPLSESEQNRTAAHLAVAPTITVLTAINAPPMLLQNRFIVRIHEDGSIYVMTMGYFSTSVDTMTPATKRTPFIFSVSSPDLRDSATERPGSLSCTVSYRIRHAMFVRIEDEISKRGSKLEEGHPFNTC